MGLCAKCQRIANIISTRFTTGKANDLKLGVLP